MSVNRERKGHDQYPWTRFWVRRSGSLDLADGGYFVDPEDHPYLVTSEDTFTLADLREVQCLALLGEPGIGKSTALASLVAAAEGTPHLSLNLSAFTTDFLLRDEAFNNPPIRAWAAAEDSEFTLFLDGLDECLLRVQSVGQLLLHELSKLPVSRLRLRVACRTADWPALLTTGLSDHWPDRYEELELAPLRRRDVRSAASLQGLDPDAFLDEVRRLEMVQFANRPITLDFLLRQSRDTGVLAATANDLYEKGCVALVSELSPSRHASHAAGALTASQRMEIASRTAATCLLARKPTILSGPGLSRSSDVTIDELAWGTLEEGGRPITPEDVQEVLDTGLFSGRAEHRLGFSHWTFAEYLTARFCASLDDEQIGRLLLLPGLDGRDRVIPQLREVVGWLLVSHPALRSRVLAGDPLAALHGGLTACDASTRSANTESLLRLAAVGQLADLNLDSRTRYHHLQHSGIADQLRPFIVDRGARLVARRMAIDIAEACDCRILVEELLSVSLDGSEDRHIRGRALHAVGRLADDAQRLRLRPLLDTNTVEDPDDELRGLALAALWPRHLSAKELFDRHITHPRRDNLLGAYAIFLYHLPEDLALDQLGAALQWVLQRAPDHDLSHRFQSLAAGIMRRAWGFLENSMVQQPFAKAAVHRLANYDPLLGDDLVVSRPRSLFDTDANGRRTAIRLIVGEMARQRVNEALRRRISASLSLVDDFSWLLDQYLDGKESTPGWLDLLAGAFSPDRIDHVERLLASSAASQRLRQHMSYWIEPVELASERADQLRKEYSLSRREPKTSPAYRPPAQEVTEQWLDKAEDGDIDAWWKLNLLLAIDPETGHANEHEFDLTKLAAWRELNEVTRQRCLTVGVSYLRVADLADEDWFCKNTLHRPAAAGYRVLRLVLAERGLDLLSGLDADIWAKWATPVLALWESPAPPAARELLGIACRVAPRVVEQGVLRLLRHCDEHRARQALEKLPTEWPPELAGVILAEARLDTFSPGKLAGVFPGLMAAVPVESRAFALALVANRTIGEVSQARALMAALALLSIDPRTSWDSLWVSLLRDEDFGHSVLEALASELEWGDSKAILSDLNERQLADFYLWIRRLVPGERTREGGHVSPREASIRLRDRVLERLKSFGTEPAVHELNRIANEYPDLPWLQLSVLEAEDNRLRREWQPLSIEKLKKLTLGMASKGDDRRFMQMAVQASRRCQSEPGKVSPKVGAVVMRDGKALAVTFRGETDRGDHAEYVALEKRLEAEVLAGATVYTTLEPCTTRNHPKVPCAQRLVERKVARVVIGMLDPNPAISGKGQRRLRDANIATELFPPDLAAQVEELNRDFRRQQEELPERARAEVYRGAGAKDEYLVTTCLPSALTSTETTHCIAIVKEGYAVDHSVETELPMATLLAVARKGTEVVGVGAIKRERKNYATSVAKKCGYAFSSGTLELGYVARSKDHGGHELGPRIVGALLAEHGVAPLWATTDLAAMRHTLAAAGFKQFGKEWKGRRGKLSLWIRG
jgi:pyrimidine deaminase RibD-like protein